MASNIKFSSLALNAFLNSLNSTLGTSALLRFYDGTQPANGDTAITTQNVLAELTLSTPDEFAAAASRVIDASSIGADVSANATGDATWASFCKSDGTRVFDVSVGEAADTTDITVDNKAFQTGATISVSDFSLGLNL
jgi:hypothetical protein